MADFTEMVIESLTQNGIAPGASALSVLEDMMREQGWSGRTIEKVLFVLRNDMSLVGEIQTKSGVGHITLYGFLSSSAEKLGVFAKVEMTVER